jgi:hypothetical protein
MAIKTALPSSAEADSDLSISPSRAGKYREAFTLPLGGGSNYWLAEEGSFFQACNATTATGIAGHAAPVIADTSGKALLHVFNSGTKNIIPVYLRLEFTAIGSGGTASYNTVYIDNAGVTARASGGTAITPVNCKSNGSSTTGATMYFGAVVTSAHVSPAKVFQAACREVIPVVTDTITVYFGASGGTELSSLTTAGTATNHIVQVAPPVVVGPGGNFNFSRIRASQSSADSYSFSFGYLER